MSSIILIAHNVRSIHNVGSLLRTAECLGVTTVYLTGYTPYPQIADDPRLPHESKRIHAQISKTALGAENLLSIHRYATLNEAVSELKQQKVQIVGIELHQSASSLPDFRPTQPTALLLGNEREGLDGESINLCDQLVQIPMLGEKESLNVVQAGAIALYQATFWKDMVK